MMSLIVDGYLREYSPMRIVLFRWLDRFCDDDLEMHVMGIDLKVNHRSSEHLL